MQRMLEDICKTATFEEWRTLLDVLSWLRLDKEQFNDPVNGALIEASWFIQLPLDYLESSNNRLLVDSHETGTNVIVVDGREGVTKAVFDVADTDIVDCLEKLATLATSKELVNAVEQSERVNSYHIRRINYINLQQQQFEEEKVAERNEWDAKLVSIASKLGEPKAGERTTADALLDIIYEVSKVSSDDWARFRRLLMVLDALPSPSTDLVEDIRDSLYGITVVSEIWKTSDPANSLRVDVVPFGDRMLRVAITVNDKQHQVPWIFSKDEELLPALEQLLNTITKCVQLVQSGGVASADAVVAAADQDYEATVANLQKKYEQTLELAANILWEEWL